VHKEGGAPIDYTWCIPNVGCEVSAYLKYIIERYDSLPDFVAFIHGHETAWHQLGDRPLLHMIRDANIQKYDFVPLNNAWRCIYKHHLEHPEHRDVLQMTLFQKLQNAWICDTGAQFIVSKKRILQNEKDVYINIYNAINTQIKAIIMELTWHFIFHETLLHPQDDFFNPPLKEILYAESNRFVMNRHELRFGYIGCNEAPPHSIQIKDDDEVVYYLHRGYRFFVFSDDTVKPSITSTNYDVIYSSDLYNYMTNHFYDCEYFITLNTSNTVQASPE
jgi:hypothetical protein